MLEVVLHHSLLLHQLSILFFHLGVLDSLILNRALESFRSVLGNLDLFLSANGLTLVTLEFAIDCSLVEEHGLALTVNSHIQLFVFVLEPLYFLLNEFFLFNAPKSS